MVETKKSGVLNDCQVSDMGIWVAGEGMVQGHLRIREERQRVQVRVRFQHVRYTNENVKKSSC